MADPLAADATHHAHAGEVTKRDLLQLVTVAGAAIGAGAIAWPLIELDESIQGRARAIRGGG